MKIFMSNYILQCRICSKLPENRVSWEKNRVSREKIEFWAFGQNRVSLETHKKKSLAVYQKTGINLYCKSDVLKPSVECLRDQKPPLGLYASI